MFIDITGNKYGKLTAIERVGKDKYNNAVWLCKCDCGNTKIIDGKSLRDLHTKSCGCLKSESSRSRTLKHNGTGTRLHSTWMSMKKRCYGAYYAEYYRYGGRGIKVCDEWRNSFETFRDWALSHGYADNLTIDRINLDGDYEPDNCRWITKQEQAYNRSDSVFVEYDGKRQTIAEWAVEKNIDYHKLYYRIKKGWSMERALCE